MGLLIDFPAKILSAKNKKVEGITVKVKMTENVHFFKSWPRNIPWPRSKENDMNETKRSTPYLLHKEYLDSDDSNAKFKLLVAGGT